MLAAVILEGVALVGAVLVLAGLIFRLNRDWALERRELLNRIQRPEFIPVDPVAFEVPEPEPDESNLVGTIHYQED